MSIDMTTMINMQSDVIFTLIQLGRYGESSNYSYNAMLVNAINATGKPIEELTVQELLDICQRTTDTFNKQFA